MTWDEYRRHASGYVIRQTRDWERTRMICTQIVNMLASKPIKPTDYMWLSTDGEQPETAAAGETEEEFWTRMQAANFFQKPAAEMESEA